MQTTTSRTAEDREETIEEAPPANKADLSTTDELLDKIDELLEDPEEERKRLFKEKIRSIAFHTGRTKDPCADVIRVPEYMMERLLRTGMFRESNCQGC